MCRLGDLRKHWSKLILSSVLNCYINKKGPCFTIFFVVKIITNYKFNVWLQSDTCSTTKLAYNLTCDLIQINLYTAPGRANQNVASDKVDKNSKTSHVESVNVYRQASNSSNCAPSMETFSRPRRKSKQLFFSPSMQYIYILLPFVTVFQHCFTTLLLYYYCCFMYYCRDMLISYCAAVLL